MSVVLTAVLHLTPGVSGYNRGCRCPECRAAKSVMRKQYQTPQAKERERIRDLERRSSPEAKAAKAAYDKKYKPRVYDSAQQRAWTLWKKYKITIEQYEEMLASQDGHCAICPNGPGAMGVLAVDHDHSCCPGRYTCGKCIRGLLCWPCNSFLGRVGDDLTQAIAYLKGGPR